LAQEIGSIIGPYWHVHLLPSCPCKRSYACAASLQLKMMCLPRASVALAAAVWCRQFLPLESFAVGQETAVAVESSGTTQLLGSACEEDAAEAICLGADSEHVMLPPALPAGIVGFWSFDDSLPLDASGNNMHGLASVHAGPAFAGQGSSAHFFKSNFMVVAHQPKMALKDFSYTFWVHLLDDTSGNHQGLRVCPLLRKGGAANALQDGQAPLPPAPAILLDRQTRHLRIEVATSGGPPGDMVELGTEAFESNALLARGRWFHIALVRLNGQRRTRLYVNGILDASQSSKGYTAPNSGPLYVGGDAGVRDQCNVPMYIDELKVYSRALDHDEIQAEAAPSLAGVEPSFLRLACVECPLVIAQKNCPDKYHICNSLELHMGGYQVARTLGYLQKGTHVWSHATAHNSKGKENVIKQPPGGGFSSTPRPSGATGSNPVLGLGLCCADAA